MEIDGRQVLSALKNYFNYGEPDIKPFDLFWFLLLPGLVLIIYLLYYGLKGFLKGDEEEERLEYLKPEDYELFDSIRLQKGLESYDRDFLIGLCEEFEVEAIKVLLDKEIFHVLEKKHRKKIEDMGLEYLAENSGMHLRKMKKKLFN